jgi:hypothetical protein
MAVLQQKAYRKRVFGNDRLTNMEVFPGSIKPACADNQEITHILQGCLKKVD